MSSQSTPWNQYARTLDQKLPSGQSAVYSPLSIWTALSMLEPGAEKETKAELRKALGIDGQTPKIAEVTRKMSTDLSFANAGWIAKDLSVKPAYAKILKENYDAKFEQLDFKKDPETARKAINQWVAQKTKEKIKDILQPKTITELTRFVLANAVYFKGEWRKPFDLKWTKDEDFHLAPNRKIKVPMMHASSYHDHFADNEIEAVKLAYKAGLSFLVIMPKKQEGWRGPARAPEEILNLMKSKLVNLGLPRFKIEFELPQAADIVKKTGIERIFDRDRSQLLGIVEQPLPLFVSVIIHKAMIDVNETGTEAAAATVMAMESGAGMPPKPVNFTANHPFRFYIIHDESKSVVFSGQYFGG